MLEESIASDCCILRCVNSLVDRASNVEVLVVKLFNSAVVQGNVRADPSLCHLSSNRLAGTLWMQLSLHNLIEVVLYYLERYRRSGGIVFKVFRYG